MRLYAWWTASPAGPARLDAVIVSAYLLYFFKARLFEMGPEITRKEWFVSRRHAGADHARHHQHPHGGDESASPGTLPLIDPNARSRK